ncbi:MAG: hypothetical protein V2A62_00945 [Candidatus Woesearchaeota archaeon]
MAENYEWFDSEDYPAVLQAVAMELFDYFLFRRTEAWQKYPELGEG